MSQIIRKTNLEALQKIRMFVDAFGCGVASQLIEFNKVGKYANAMTNLLFQSKIKLN